MPATTVPPVVLLLRAQCELMDLQRKTPVVLLDLHAPSLFLHHEQAAELKLELTCLGGVPR